ncbi:S-layer homology domain-containing protein [Paenibacillus sambharensis]|uniref:S-layer homology domain-containing protein n=1 Tax=Paenibacillus sambharensis TaxID=1803190 RepID=A0A2W1LAY4_9BACL|nr:S-layer homology domain-containing protein [Paenibacillus sambharensis]PZD96376.1 S-layer homology domain-containing protein [Paenibacillus sambharensis]
MNKLNKTYEVKQLKPMFKQKTAGLLAFLLTFSLLLPALAYANGFSNLQHNSDNTVTGRVYIDEATYDLLKEKGILTNRGIALQVYNSNDWSSPITTTYATYSTYKPVDGDSYYYYEVNFNATTVTGSTYTFPLSVSYATYSTVGGVTYATYNASGPISAYSGPVSGGGGYIPPFVGPVANNGELTPDLNGRVNAQALADALKANKNVTIKISGKEVIIPASALSEGESITIVTESGVSYKLPIAALEIAKLAQQLGVNVADLEIVVSIAELEGAAAAGVTTAVYAAGGKVVAPIVDFTVKAVSGTKEVAINNFPVFVERGLPLNETVTNLNTVTGVVYKEGAGVSFVPATFATADGKTTATLKRKSNSIYTVIQVGPKSFTDLTNHWAKADVEKLASKLVVEGTGKNLFQPKRNVTRAEFAAMVARSLGLDTSVTSSTYSFSDVSSNSWYAGTVAAAAEAGLINGYTNGTFKPNANITRQEVAAIVVRALEYAGKGANLSTAEVNAALAGYTDAATLGWAKEEVAAAVKSGIVLGQTSTKINGKAQASRAEAATMVIRFLDNADFIN